MGKERAKATQEQFDQQKHIHKGGQADDLKIGQALMSPGPYWYNGYDDTLNGDLLAAEIIDDLGLTRKRTGIYNGEDRIITDQEEEIKWKYGIYMIVMAMLQMRLGKENPGIIRRSRKGDTIWSVISW